GLSLRRSPFGKWRTGLARSQHPARHDADVTCARDCRARGAFVRRAAELDGGGRFVFALKTGQSGKAGGPRPAFFGLSLPVGSLFPGRFVLPRFLRRPVRLISRLCDGEYAPPRYAGVIATAVFLSSSALYGAWLGGQIPVPAQAATARPGFAVDPVRVSGNQRTSAIAILGRLRLDRWTSAV